MWNPGLPPSLVLPPWLSLCWVGPCISSPPPPAPLPPTGPLWEHRNSVSQGLRETLAHLVGLLPHHVSHTVDSLAPGPPLCSAQKPLDSETGDPSVPQQIPSPSGHWAGLLRPGPQCPLPTQWRLRCHFFPQEVGSATCSHLAWSVSREMEPCSLPQHQPRNSSPADNGLLSLEDTGNREPLSR